MKRWFFCSLAVGPLAACLLLLIAATTQAAIILVDYDDGIPNNGIHDVAVRNGGFESPPAGDFQPFSNTDNWINLQGSQTEEARRTNFQDTGIFSSVNNNSPTKMFGLDTEYTVALGDVFDLQFSARRALKSSRDTTLTADLFVTDDDTITGNVAAIIGTVIVSNMPKVFTTYGDTFGPILAGDPAIGKRLFLRFEQSDGPGYSRTDSWYLVVTPVPEPMSLLIWLGLPAVGSVLLVRRRRR